MKRILEDIKENTLLYTLFVGSIVLIVGHEFCRFLASVGVPWMH